MARQMVPIEDVRNALRLLRKLNKIASCKFKGWQCFLGNMVPLFEFEKDKNKQEEIRKAA